MQKIVVIGGGGHSKIIINLIKKSKIFNIIGYSDVVDNGELLGIQYLGNDESILQLIKNCNAVLGIGNLNNNLDQLISVVNKYKKMGFVFPAIISKNAVVNENVQIGEGTVISDGVIINSVTKIGSFCILNTKVSIDHDSNIGNFVHLAPGSTICGGVRIGDYSFIGAGTTVIPNINIAEKCYIGAGSLVVKNINNSGLYYGVPVKKII